MLLFVIQSITVLAVFGCFLSLVSSLPYVDFEIDSRVPESTHTSLSKTPIVSCFTIDSRIHSKTSACFFCCSETYRSVSLSLCSLSAFVSVVLADQITTTMTHYYYYLLRSFAVERSQLSLLGRADSDGESGPASISCAKG